MIFSAFSDVCAGIKGPEDDVQIRSNLFKPKYPYNYSHTTY